MLFLIIADSFDRNLRVYAGLVFFLGLAVYFFVQSDWRFSEWKNELKQGKKFWLPVLFTALGMGAMFGLSTSIAMLFPNTDSGMSVYSVNNWSTLIAFAFTTIILPPIAEEVFYRKSIIAFNSKTVTIISSIVSVFLFAGVHSLLPFGFLQACLWGVPFTIAYVKTKNVYVCMTAHFFCNFVVNGMTVINVAIHLSS
jgi:membrane protease YdiL (CAAX protease family)